MATYTISSADVNSVHVEAQPTVLTGTPTQNKKVFDAYCDMIVNKFNTFVNHVETDISTEISAAVIALYTAHGYDPDDY